MSTTTTSTIIVDHNFSFHQYSIVYYSACFTLMTSFTHWKWLSHMALD